MRPISISVRLNNDPCPMHVMLQDMDARVSTLRDELENIFEMEAFLNADEENQSDSKSELEPGEYRIVRLNGEEMNEEEALHDGETVLAIGIFPASSKGSR